jgi:alpha-beta hydrolase superfamily lysophospholipase
VRAAVGLLAAAVALAVAAPASSAYRNPTAGAALVYQIPGMHRAKVRRNLVYQRVDGSSFRLDVYRPRRAGASARLPAVLLGGPAGAGRATGQKIGWSQAIAASGMAAVAFDIRSDERLSSPRAPAEDVAAAIAYVRANAVRLGIDADRLCTLGFSIGTAPWHLWATMRDPQPFVRCNVVYYGALDFESDAWVMDDAARAEFSALTYLRRHGASIPPMLVVSAGREEFRGIAESIPRFVAEAARVHADVRLLTHPTGHHGFDLQERGRRSRALIAQTLRYLRTRLAPPLQARHDCLTADERARAVRLFAEDDTRLVGVEFGTGARGVVLAHQGGGAPPNLCAWAPYARHLAAAGYHILALDHRSFGFSGTSPVSRNFRRVDLDVVAAVDELRRRGGRSVVLGGASLGGSAVLAAAASIRPAVDGVISFAAPETFRTVNALAAVRTSTVPALFVSAAEDDGFAETAERFYAASPAADKQLLIAPGSVHGAPVLEDARTLAAVDAWIAAHSTG